MPYTTATPFRGRDECAREGGGRVWATQILTGRGAGVFANTLTADWETPESKRCPIWREVVFVRKNEISSAR